MDELADAKARSEALRTHILILEEKLRRQAGEIRNMQLDAERRNVERKALNILVACDGPCNRAYMDDPSKVTYEVVRSVHINANRLISWWNRGGVKARDAYRKRWSLPLKEVQRGEG